MEIPARNGCVLSEQDAGRDGQNVAKSADISEELDNFAFRILDIVQSIVSEQDCLQEALSNGYVNMAKARYIMGNKSVSMMQVNKGDMVASCLVHTKMDCYSGVEYTNFKIAEEHCQDYYKKEDQELRHRKVKNKADKVEISTVPEEVLADGKEETDNYITDGKNPLQWFGVLVPKSLRDCQSHFREGLVMVAKIASLKSELLAAHRRYKELLAQEKEIQRAS